MIRNGEKKSVLYKHDEKRIFAKISYCLLMLKTLAGDIDIGWL